MKFITKISDPLKIVILTGYTLIAVLIAFLLINNKTEVKIMKEYDTVAYDENVKLVVRLREDRKSSYANSSDYESSTYYFAAYLEKQQNTMLSKFTNIRFFIAGENANGKISFDEYSSSYTISDSKNISGGPSTTVNFSSNRKFQKTIKVENDSPVVEDTTPVKVYLRVLYTVKHEGTDVEIDKQLNYTFDLNKIGEIDFDSFESKSINETTKKVENEDYPIDLKVETTYNEYETSKGSAKYDKITLTASLENSKLEGKEITSYQTEVFAKVKNDVKDKENRFDDYIRVYTISGSSLITTGTKMSCEVDEKYDLSVIYIISKVTFNDGSTKELKYKVELTK